MKLRHTYTPRGACREVFHARGSEVIVSGPAGTGKSRACLEKLNMLMLANPGARGLILRKVAVTLATSGLVTWEKYVIPEATVAGLVKFFGGSPREPASYRYTNGSVVVVGGMDDPNKVMSTEYDVIYVQEVIEFTLTDWEKCTTRLRNGVISFQQIIADTNPDRPTHWVKERANSGSCVMLESRHEDNPVYFNEDGTMTPAGKKYIGILDKLTGVRRLRLRYGKWVAAEGLIYEEWDDAIHVVDHFDPPADWPRIWGMDFGYTNPFVCQMWARDPDGRLWMYREIYHSKRDVDAHCRNIIALVSDPDPDYVHPENEDRFAHHGRIWHDPKPEAIVCDHDAGDRAIVSRELGMGTRAARKDVEDGILAVKERVHIADDGKPRIFVMRGACVERDPDLTEAGKPASTEEEIPGYVYNPGPKLAAMAGETPKKEEPVKKNDHGCDTMRYVVMDEDQGARPRVSWV